MNVTLNIDADAVVKHTARLERIHKSALPVAVRSSLNAAAFDVKTNTMPKTAKKFVQRAPTFFKAQSKVKPAEGFNIQTMVATVGFMKGNAAKETGYATQDLEQQEEGGMIDKRAFIPVDAARAGKSHKRRVSNKYRLAAIKKAIFNAKSSRLKVKGKQAFILSAIYAQKGGFVLGQDKKNGNRSLLVINSVKRVGKDTKVNSTAIYKVKAKRKVSVKKTNFMRTASEESGKKIEQYYIKEATKQLQKYK